MNKKQQIEKLCLVLNKVAEKKDKTKIKNFDLYNNIKTINFAGGKNMEKNELIANLYGLRAGLSRIAVEKDIVDRKQKEIEVVNEQIDLEEDRIKKIRSEISSLKTDIRNEERRCQDRKQLCDKKRKENLKDWTLGALAYTLLWGGFIVYILLIFPFFILPITAAKARKEKESYQIECDNKIKEYNQRILDKENEIKEQQAKINTLKATNLVDMQRRYDREAVPAIKRAQTVDIALKNTYAPIIMQSDWENIDMLIYYLSTGRADDLKEALQLYDRQKQTDEIVGAIKQAEYTIANEIRSGFHALGTAMVKCFQVLSNQLSEQHAETMQALGNLNQSIQDNTAAIAASSAAQVLSDKELKKALTDKINISSKRLVDDMKKMQMEIRILNSKTA